MIIDMIVRKQESKLCKKIFSPYICKISNSRFQFDGKLNVGGGHNTQLVSQWGLNYLIDITVWQREAKLLH